MTNAVMINLEALASGIGRQDVDTACSFYTIARDRLLESEEEREAFRYGALAMFADAGKMRVKAAYYRRKFNKAMNQLQK